MAALFRVPLLRSAAVVAAVFALAACGSPTAPSIAETQFAESLGVDLDASIRTATGLYYRDMTVGTGAVAGQGASVDVTYELFEPSGRRIETGPISFTIGAGRLIPGFEEGVTGMRVGGVRQVIVPPHLGYPDRGILVFHITLDAIN